MSNNFMVKTKKATTKIKRDKKKKKSVDTLNLIC